MRYEEFSQKLAEQYLEKGLSHCADIPDMDLYIDQLVNFLNRELSIYAEGGKGPVTRAMVSNYTKHRMIPRPEGKRYTRMHCIFMMLAFHLKGCLSMEQVARMMRPILANYSSCWDESLDMPDMYAQVIEFVKNSEKDFVDRLQKRIDSIKKFLGDRGSDDDLSELTMLITTLIMRSNGERFLAQKLLEEYFPDSVK